MNILICNDDGIESNGLKKLAEKFALKHNILVVAPDKNWSACSHLLSINDAIEITEYKGIKGCTAYKISGSPVDCVKIARHVFSDFIPSAVISGINRGHNLGSDILYSGTVAIAYEAAFFGIPSFAFSAFSHGESDFELYSDYCMDIFEKIITKTNAGGIWNVNFPESNKEIAGIKITPLSKSVYTDKYIKTEDGKLKLFGIEHHNALSNDCDLFWNDLGYITVTPLVYDKTDYNAINSIGDICIK